MSLVWRGRKDPDQPQNANGGNPDLSPASEAPKLRQVSNWAATLSGTDQVPLIWEDSSNGTDSEDLQHY